LKGNQLLQTVPQDITQVSAQDNRNEADQLEKLMDTTEVALISELWNDILQHFSC